MLADRKWLRLLGAAAGLLAAVVAAAPPVLFPHLRLPKPSGPHAVGTLNLHFIDRGRPETFTPDPHDHREVCARVWYPAEEQAGRRTISYAENAREIGRALTRHAPVPRFVFDHLGLVRAHSYRDAEPVRGRERLPVLIFSHAYWAGISQSTVLMEDLASHGYVAVSIAHAHETPYFIQADETIKGFDPRNEEFCLRGTERRRALEVQQRITLTRDPQVLESLVREIARLRPKAVESVRIWAQDISSTIDELERMDTGNGLLAGRLDTSAIGVLGHSCGGAAAGQACLTDERCKAGINMDGLQLGDMLDRPLAKPFMFMHHDNAAANRTPNLIFFEKAAAPAYLVWIRGTGHLSFCDLTLYGPGSLFRLTAPLGTIEGRRCSRIVGDLVLAFFDTHLRGRASPLLSEASRRYPELEMSVRGPSTAQPRSQRRDVGCDQHSAAPITRQPLTRAMVGPVWMRQGPPQ